MSMQYEQRMKKSAQNATTVTLVPDTVGGASEGHPVHLAATQIVLTFTATKSDMWGTTTADGRTYLVTIKQTS